MRAQLSLELLIVILSSIVMLSLFLPEVQKVKDISDYALVSRNAQLILDKLYYSCERASITGESEAVRLYSLSNYSLMARNGELTIGFGEKSISRRFNCALALNLSKGMTEFTLRPDS